MCETLHQMCKSCPVLPQSVPAATRDDATTSHDAAIALLDDDRQHPPGHIEPPVTAYVKTSHTAAATSDGNDRGGDVGNPGGHTPPPSSSSFDEANERFVAKMLSTRVEPAPTAAAVGELSGDAKEESTARHPFTPEGCDLVGTRLRPREQPGNTIADAGGSSIPTTCCHPGCKSTDSSFLSNFFGKQSSKTLKQCAQCHRFVCVKHSTRRPLRTLCKSCPAVPPSVAT